MSQSCSLNLKTDFNINSIATALPQHHVASAWLLSPRDIEGGIEVAVIDCFHGHQCRDGARLSRGQIAQLTFSRCSTKHHRRSLAFFRSIYCPFARQGNGQANRFPRFNWSDTRRCSMSTLFLIVLLGAWGALFLPIILCLLLPKSSEALRPEVVPRSKPQLQRPSTVQAARQEQPIPARTRRTANNDRRAA